MVYESIYECPILNYQRVIETGDFRHLLIKYNKDHIGDLRPAFEKLNGQIIDEFELPELNRLIFQKEKQIVKLKSKYILTEDESLETSIQLAEIELKRIKKRVNIEVSIRQIHAKNHRVLSAWSKRDSRQLSVFEYYNDLRDFEKESEQKTLDANTHNKRRVT